MEFLFNMVKKGKIKEIISKALFADKPDMYKILFRDFDKIKELSLREFIKESNNFETIPASRIQMIKKGNTILFNKINAEVR